MSELSAYVDIWWSGITDFTLLLEELPQEAWATPTDLPGWTVRDVAAHTAHLEHLLAGGRHDDIKVVDAPHARGFMGEFTEQGVIARLSRSKDELINEIRESATATHTAILSDGVPEGTTPAREPFGSIGWTSRTLWRNRPLDLWMHEQDVRRAVGIPGNLDSPGALHSINYLSDSLGLVLAKRVGAPAGTVLRLEVDGHTPRGFTVNESGRGEELDEVPSSVDVTLSFDRESFARVAGGRGTADRVTISGDEELGAKILSAMVVTP
ncbi:maleylpyruvate isomerase family mycothiol-dependent enzyme [Nocardioides gilvus]|uniref:maleylpyruvate isomerase family mycothiol-dependent enzyme n=1 Tax=Nocardioides gilvus TaxID=1735589 RepID=UPI000D74E4BC|nr:maleylpyruvate isomerase family mycothiol-dependent enzyme [Nocardioides gilvus]